MPCFPLDIYPVSPLKFTRNPQPPKRVSGLNLIGLHCFMSLYLNFLYCKWNGIKRMYKPSSRTSTISFVHFSRIKGKATPIISQKTITVAFEAGLLPSGSPSKTWWIKPYHISAATDRKSIQTIGCGLCTSLYSTFFVFILYTPLVVQRMYRYHRFKR
jgi:hypothetical protein